MHVISGLGTGGAENFLLRLLSSLRDKGVAGRVISIMAGGGMVSRFREADVGLLELGVNGPGHWRQVPTATRDLFRAVRQWRPHIVQGWMNHGNVAACLAWGRATPKPKLIWSIRQTLYDVGLEAPGTRMAIRLQSWLSSSPDAVVCNSHVGLAQHARLGFRNRRMFVIPNGFDVEKLYPQQSQRSAARDLVGIDPDAFVVAMIARSHPMKDYNTFVEAIALAAPQVPGLHAVCVGRGVDGAPSALPARVTELGIGHMCTLLGERTDLEDIYPGIDVVCLTSAWGEGFPNVLGEAMAYEIPCVATDVGDAPQVVGNTGRIVAPRSPAEVAAAIVELFRIGPERRKQLGQRARMRIVEEYSIDTIAGKYMDLYDSLFQEKKCLESA